VTWLRVLVLRIREVFAKGRLDAELDEELQAHLEMLAEQNMERGMSGEEARRAAKIALGGTEQIKEAVRDQRGMPLLESLVANVRFGLRILRKNPGFGAVVVLTLALGIGANTAIFTVAYAALLAPLPYPQPGQLVNIRSELQGHPNFVSSGDFKEWKRQSTTFEDLNASGTNNFNIATQDRPEFFNGMEATPGYYGMLGNPLFLGRNFLAEEGEQGKEHVVILTHRLWRHLGANPKIIGQTMQINGEPYVVVGVFAPGTADRWDWQLIVPLVFKPEQLSDHDSRYWLVTGRLKPGVSIKQAQAEMDAITAQEAKEYPKSNQGWGALVEPYENVFLPSDRQRTLWLLLGAVGFLLLIACLNVANLLLAKGITRQKEVAIRGALGARPGAIFAQFLTESLVLAILGGLLGVAVGYAMLRGLVAAMPPESLPAEADLRLNVPILLIMLAATTLAGVLFGYAPAWYASRFDPAGVLKEGGRSGTGTHRHRLRRVLVIAEFGLALPLLTGAGLAIHSFWNLTHVDLGVRTDHILGFYIDPASLAPLEDDPKQLNAYYRRILASIETVPGVSHVSAMTYLPLDIFDFEKPFTIGGKPAYANPSLRPNAHLQEVTPDYFQTFGIRVVKGRSFTDSDSASSLRVAMVNEVFANRFLKGLDPLDQRVLMEQEIPGQDKLGPPVEWLIVGVFHTVKNRGAREDNPEIDVPFWQMASPVAAIGVLTAEDPAAMLKSIAGAVNAADPQAALALTRTMEQVHDQVLANDRFTLILFASFAVVGLLLAAVGIQGVTAFSVAQRSHEIAVRMALGATRNRVVALVVREGLVLACVGLGLGLAGAYFVGHAMQSILFDVGVIDFPTIDAVGLVLLLAALLACYVPARRATKVDPMVALRHE
jgi:putative ABC transport system permease protein